jgi:hypothetical protein
MTRGPRSLPFWRRTAKAIRSPQRGTAEGSVRTYPIRRLDYEDQSMDVLTQRQAYAATFHFLEEFWKRTRSDDVGGLLGAMSLLQDGSPADPAMAQDWRAAVEYALKGGEAGSLELKR